MKKVGKLFCRFAEMSYLCTRFRKKSGRQAKRSDSELRSKISGASTKPKSELFALYSADEIFDILQTATRQRPYFR